MALFTRLTFQAIRPFSMRASMSTAPTQHYKFVVAGGGAGGSSIAHRLIREYDEKDVVVIEPSKMHHYQAGWTLVGGGLFNLTKMSKLTKKVYPEEMPLIEESVTKFEPEKNRVQLSDGSSVTYDYLVISLGMALRYDRIPGAIEALEMDRRVCSNYSKEYVEKTYSAMQRFTGGKAIFTLPPGPIKCAGAPQKVMYLFEDFMRKNERRDTADVHFFTALPQMFSVDKYSDALAKICEERNINTHLQHELLEVNHKRSHVYIKDMQSGRKKLVGYEFLHIVPPMSPPDVLLECPALGNPEMDKYVDVDVKTLRHKRFSNIFSLGDCAAIPTSKTAAAVASQSKVLFENLRHAANGGKGSVAEYDGYTSCPLVTGYGKAILAEFDYDRTPLETFPIDGAKENYFFYLMKVLVLPPIYWDWLIRGYWSGPAAFRNILNPSAEK